MLSVQYICRKLATHSSALVRCSTSRFSAETHNMTGQKIASVVNAMDSNHPACCSKKYRKVISVANHATSVAIKVPEYPFSSSHG